MRIQPTATNRHLPRRCIASQADPEGCESHRKIIGNIESVLLCINKLVESGLTVMAEELHKKSTSCAKAVTVVIIRCDWQAHSCLGKAHEHRWILVPHMRAPCRHLQEPGCLPGRYLAGHS